MRKHELQARLRELKSKNTTLSSLISQLGMEWKEVRISFSFFVIKALREEVNNCFLSFLYSYIANVAHPSYNWTKSIDLDSNQ